MRGNGYKSIVAENLKAVMSFAEANQSMSRKKRMCWRCQKDKSTVGGHIKMFVGGPMKFICKECIEAKLKEKNA
jgi:late competence protein required for DNA uptake (superfamily II DNA/RNA helicase)